MLKQFAKLNLSGRVANEPILEYTPKGKALLKFGMFVNDGDESDYFMVTAWENNAKYLVDRIEKGDLVNVDAKLKGSFYGESNNKKYSNTIVVTDVIAYEKKSVVVQEGEKVE